MKEFKFFVTYSTGIIIMEPIIGPYKMKLLMLNTKISKIILCPFETKGLEGEEKRENASD